KAQKLKSSKAQKHPARPTDLLLNLTLIRGIPLTHAVPNSPWRGSLLPLGREAALEPGDTVDQVD
ncbi:hypothetical protein, partial [Pseudomonas sp. NFACC54]|uniref:hypothetical protein n=1 Tax=Pseudomonas sp. NFACC54 TaxID=1566218 RepID=UPI001C455194